VCWPFCEIYVHRHNDFNTARSNHRYMSDFVPNPEDSNQRVLGSGRTPGTERREYVSSSNGIDCFTLRTQTISGRQAKYRRIRERRVDLSTARIYNYKRFSLISHVRLDRENVRFDFVRVGLKSFRATRRLSRLYTFGFPAPSEAVSTIILAVTAEPVS